jgi:hypothetical protein
VTTPHGCKPGASGMTRMCRPTPIARFMHTSETKLTATCVSHGTANVWDARAFTQGSLPWNLQTRLSCQCAKELLLHSFVRRQKWKVLLRLRAAHLSSPCVNAGAFRRGLVNGLYCFQHVVSICHSRGYYTISLPACNCLIFWKLLYISFRRSSFFCFAKRDGGIIGFRL